MINSHFLSMNVYLRERESFFTNKHNYGIPSNNSFSQSNPNVMKTFKCLLICSINHEDIFYCLRMDNDQYNTMLIFANYLLSTNENQTSMSKSHTNNTPFVEIKTKSKRKETIKERIKLHTQKRELKNN